MEKEDREASQIPTHPQSISNRTYPTTTAILKLLSNWIIGIQERNSNLGLHFIIHPTTKSKFANTYMLGNIDTLNRIGKPSCP